MKDTILKFAQLSVTGSILAFAIYCWHIEHMQYIRIMALMLTPPCYNQPKHSNREVYHGERFQQAAQSYAAKW